MARLRERLRDLQGRVRAWLGSRKASRGERALERRAAHEQYLRHKRMDGGGGGGDMGAV
jgi:hypothetical protein